MSYGKVISGGKAMTNGLTKGINSKLKGFEDGHKRGQTLATAVGKAFNQNPLSENHLNNINVAAAKKFTTPKIPAKV
tara:strand:+ start:462 stop:692 length:231 start_codon:yes stop_codon:yes gene_type:complete